MLAARRGFTVLEEQFRTPLIVPSYSSRAVEDDVRDVIDITRSFVSGPILVSAYDIKHCRVTQKRLSHASLVFLDSGGYEAGSQSDFSEVEDPRKTKAKTTIDRNWKISDYREVISRWDYNYSTVLVTYDQPDRRESLSTQIARAKRNLVHFPDAAHVILLKPESIGRRLRKNERLYLNIDKIVSLIPDLALFSIIGVTEKELGDSVFERMKSIAVIRKSLLALDKEIPIHIFGSLDPVSTPLYFLSGADIFDGLTWLRYAYHSGLAIYRQNYLACNRDIALRTRDGDLSASVQVRNYQALGVLEEQMKQFLQKKDFGVFGGNSEFLRNASEKLAEEVGG